MEETFVCAVCGQKEPKVRLTRFGDKLYCSDHLEQGQQDLAIAELAKKFPDQTAINLYLFDHVERLLTNSRDQTKYLKSIKSILTFFVVITILGIIFSLLKSCVGSY